MNNINEDVRTGNCLENCDKNLSLGHMAENEYISTSGSKCSVGFRSINEDGAVLVLFYC